MLDILQRETAMRAISLMILAAVVLSTGCRNTCRRPLFGDRGLFNRRDSAAAAPRFDPPVTGRAVDPTLIPPPEGGLPTPPPDAAPVPRGGVDLPPPVVPETRNKPAEPKGKELMLPDPLPPGKSGLESPAAPAPSTSSKMPSGTAVPGFSTVKDGIATGRKPGLDGLETLRAAGYKTIVYLHAADADVAAAKAVAEKRGLAFVAIPVTTEDFPAAFEKFAKIIDDSAQRPVYICDDDGARTGSVWYTQFRVEGMSDDAAQVKAAPLGLRENAADRAKLLAAAQDYISKR